MATISKTVLMLGAGVTVAFAFAIQRGLSKDEIKLLEDPGGWEYVSVSNQNAGIQTQHVCFDGTPHPGECSGKLMLNRDNTFVQQVNIRGQSIDRHGRYTIEEHQISFFDEFGTRDGPYDLQLNSNTKLLTLSMPQVRIILELQSQYKDNLDKKKAPPR
jgi:hypothetical protein